MNFDFESCLKIFFFFQQEVIFTSHPQPFWMQVSFRYIMAGCGALVFILTAALVSGAKSYTSITMFLEILRRMGMSACFPVIFSSPIWQYGSCCCHWSWHRHVHWCLTLFLYLMGKALSGKLSCTQTDLMTKGDNFHDFLFAIQADETLPKRSTFKGINLLLQEQILSFKGWPLSRNEAK